MTWYPDLSPCGYFEEMAFGQARAVGWLARGVPHERGPVDVAMVEGLETIRVLSYEPVHFLGWHTCELCPDGAVFDEPIHFQGSFLGVHNLWVPGDGEVFVAPDLVVHYVGEHWYRPPEEFRIAVEGCPKEPVSYAEALLTAAPEPLRAGLDDSVARWLSGHHDGRDLRSTPKPKRRWLP